MARKVFFSFHYEKDAWRAAQARNSGMVKGYEDCGFIDSVDWESIKKGGDEAIKRWIKDQMNGTSVTVVLIGAETASRQWIIYELTQSLLKGNSLLGVYIHKNKDKDGSTSAKGLNPLDYIKLASGDSASKKYKTYDYIDNDGYNNMGKWIEESLNL